MAEAHANYSLGGYDEDFVDVVEDEWNCPICQLPLKEAVQTGVCGHRFCWQCLDGHFERQERDGEPLTCPVDRNNLTREKDMFLDKATERKIRSFIIKCPSEGCQWTGELRSKDGHLVSCSFKLVSCTNNNCQVALPRTFMHDHVTKTCQWRIIHCDHCHASHPLCKTEAHQNGCKRFPLACPNKCGAISIPREEISAHIEEDCMMAIISCPYADMGCVEMVQRGKVESHLQSDMRLHLDLACVKLHKTEVLFRETTKKLEEKISALENKPVFTWRIRGFSEILMTTTAGTKILSAPFYTGENGYKARLRLYPKGAVSGKNNYLSLYLVLMKGEYDPILPWPFHKKLIFILIDQNQNLNGREDIVKSITTDPGDLLCNARPKIEENPAAKGSPRFVSHDEIKEKRYIVDDTIFIQVKVVSP